MKLPKQITRTLYIVLHEEGWLGDENRLQIMDFKPSSPGYIVLGTQEVTLDVPQVDVTLQQIESLERQAETIQRKAAAKVQEIHDRIQSLRAIEHQGA